MAAALALLGALPAEEALAALAAYGAAGLSLFPNVLLAPGCLPLT